MTVKKSNAKVANVKYSANENLAIQTAETIVAVGTMSETINDNCQKIHKNLKGNKLGTVKSGDAVMIRFTETLTALGKAEQTVKNYATAFRSACNEGKPFSMNAYRKPSKKGAKGSESNSTGVKLVIKGEPTAEQVSKALREIFNAEKFREKYAELASFMTDALDEYDGE
jgi:hypothetical protein